MSHFFAEFDVCGSPSCIIRKDTRIYYHPQTFTSSLQQAGRCVGVIWMCNPGSAARPSHPIPWGAIKSDQTLRAVHDLYVKVVAARGAKQPTPGQDDYIGILNCYYAVDADFKAAYAKWCNGGCKYKEKIPKKAGFVVVAWGRYKPQGPVFQSIKSIKRWAKKSASKSQVVYIDEPVTGTPQIGHDLSTMNYPAHPLSSQFKSNASPLAQLL